MTLPSRDVAVGEISRNAPGRRRGVERRRDVRTSGERVLQPSIPRFSHYSRGISRYRKNLPSHNIRSITGTVNASQAAQRRTEEAQTSRTNRESPHSSRGTPHAPMGERNVVHVRKCVETIRGVETEDGRTDGRSGSDTTHSTLRGELPSGHGTSGQCGKRLPIHEGFGVSPLHSVQLAPGAVAPQLPKGPEKTRSPQSATPGTATHANSTVTDFGSATQLRSSTSTIVMGDSQPPLGLQRDYSGGCQGDCTPVVVGTVSGRTFVGGAFPEVKGRSICTWYNTSDGGLRREPAPTDGPEGSKTAITIDSDNHLRSPSGDPSNSGGGIHGTLHKARSDATSAGGRNPSVHHPSDGKTRSATNDSDVHRVIRSGIAVRSRRCRASPLQSLPNFLKAGTRIPRSAKLSSEDLEPVFHIGSSSTKMFFPNEKKSGGFDTKDESDGEGELDWLPNTRIDVDKLATLHAAEDYTEDERLALDILRGRVPPALLLRSKRRFSKRFSKFRHMKTLDDAEITEKGPATLYLPIFTIKKKNGRLRLIVDGRQANRAFQDPPAMPLPRLYDFQEYLLDNKFAGQCDARCFFYQIGLPEEYRTFFGVVGRGVRGPRTHRRMTTVPMGWSWAPFLAQCVANILVKHIGMVWVDNFVLAAKSKSQYEDQANTFRRRCAQVGLIVDDPEMIPDTSIQVLGLRVDLTAKTIALADPKHMALFPLGNEMSARQVYEHIGFCEFATATHRPLAAYAHCMVLLQRAARAEAWTDCVTLSQRELSELTEWHFERLRNSPVTPGARFRGATMGSTGCIAFSDASDSVAA